jgi:hypothetical protein
MKGNCIFFILFSLSNLSCKTQQMKLKFPVFNEKECSVILPIRDQYKDYIKSTDHVFTVNKPEFKDGVYTLYLPQAELPSIYIAIEQLNKTKTPTVTDFSKAIIKFHDKSFQKVKNVAYSNLHSKELGEVSKVSYEFVQTDLYNVNYSFFIDNKAVTIGYSYMNDKSPVDPDEEIMQMELLCP